MNKLFQWLLLRYWKKHMLTKHCHIGCPFCYMSPAAQISFFSDK